MTPAKAAVMALCGWELGALASGRIPTLTQVCAKHPWLGPLLTVCLAVHLRRNRAGYGASRVSPATIAVTRGPLRPQGSLSQAPGTRRAMTWP